MDLVDRDQTRARRHRRDRAAAIFGERRAVVVRAEADVEAGADAGRDAAAPAEKAVRHAVQHRRADHLDAVHARSSRITGSSIGLPADGEGRGADHDEAVAPVEGDRPLAFCDQTLR